MKTWLIETECLSEDVRASSLFIVKAKNELKAIKKYTEKENRRILDVRLIKEKIYEIPFIIIK